MSDVKWIKIVTDIFDDEKMLLIDSMPDSDTIIVIWFKLLCLAGKQNNRGVFVFNGKMPYTDEMLATIFRRPLNTVRFALKTFEEFGMVEIVNNTITLPKWEKHQSLDKLEQQKEANRKRVAAFRERQKQITCNDYCNVTVTGSNAIEIDKEKEKDKEEEKEINKDKKTENVSRGSSCKKSDFDSIIAEYTDNNSVKEALYAYINMRKNIKKPMTPYALKRLLYKLDEISDCNEVRLEALGKSIDHCWQSVYALKPEELVAIKQKQEKEKYANLTEEEREELEAHGLVF